MENDKEIKKEIIEGIKTYKDEYEEEHYSSGDIEIEPDEEVLGYNCTCGHCFDFHEEIKDNERNAGKCCICNDCNKYQKVITRYDKFSMEQYFREDE